VESAPDTPLLWVLRDELGLTGAKFGCGMGMCGACTVHVNGRATRACVTPLTEVAGKTVTTIEGLSAEASHPVQRAWIAEDVAQCGYCQAGQIMTVAAYVAAHPLATEDEVVRELEGNLCRCGTYVRIRAAVRRVVGAK
jgi:aerobic-type carbon monoxide dehydrogenase small subunit (CoxS/CutS family)